MDDNTLLITMPEESNLQLPSPGLINFYNDLKNRIYWIDGEITEDSLTLIQYILKWNQEDKGISPDARKPIRLFFFSAGGSLDVQEALVSVIKLSKTPIYGIAIGMVASAASLIYLACHKKLALPNTYFILHKGSCSNVGANYNELMAMMDDYRAQVEKMIQFYINNTKIPKDVILEKIDTDWYVRGEDLINYGLIDEWITDIEVMI